MNSNASCHEPRSWDLRWLRRFQSSSSCSSPPSNGDSLSRCPVPSAWRERAGDETSTQEPTRLTGGHLQNGSCRSRTPMGAMAGVTPPYSETRPTPEPHVHRRDILRAMSEPAIPSEIVDCVVCGESAPFPMAAECNWCDQRYHLNQRNDGDAKDCGRVWIDEQHMGLQFACFNCSKPDGTPEAPHASAVEAQRPRQRRYKRRA